MRNHGLVIGAVVIACAASGCASSVRNLIGDSDEARIRASLAAWEGRPINEFLAMAPYSPYSVVAEGERTIYFFSYGRNAARGLPRDDAGQVTAATEQDNGSTGAVHQRADFLKDDCNWSFTADSDGTVVRYAYDGSACGNAEDLHERLPAPPE